MRVLLVEDDAPILWLSTQVLTRAGYTVVATRTAEEALRAAERIGEGRIDLVITDQVLPGGALGHELARELTARNPSLRVLLMSGHEKEDDHFASVVWSNRTAYLGKPFDLDELLEEVRRLLS